MLHRTMQQFLTDVYFGDLDVLLLDLPPGTGDVAISLGQLLPHAEVLVVTTPQPAAAEVAERSGTRRAADRPDASIGVVENMAGLAQPDGTVLELFGSGGGERVAARALRRAAATVPLLASIPLSTALREDADAGIPVVIAHPDDPAAVAIAALAAVIAVAAARACPAGRCRCVRGDPAVTRVRSLRCRTAGSRPGVKDLVSDGRGRHDAPAASGAHRRHRRVVEQRLADDAPRVVLARVELASSRRRRSPGPSRRASRSLAPSASRAARVVRRASGSA